MRITATTIRVPVYRSHSESVNIELEKEVDLGAMREALAKFPELLFRMILLSRNIRCRYILPKKTMFM